jgi:hypothetical protein
MVTLLLSALTFGYLLHVNYLGYRPDHEFPKWQGALPITTDRGTASGFFRRQFNLPSEPTRAYLIVSGTDQLSVYMNGELAVYSRYFGTKSTESLDITRFVHSGNNVLAVAVQSNAPHSHCELSARMELWMPDGSRKTILTDPRWRASGVEEYSSRQHVDWYAPGFSDLHWSPAQISDPPDSRPIHPYRVPEKILQSFPRGYWLGASSGDMGDTTFVRDFQVRPERITGAWLGVSAAGNYTITLNDQFLYSYAGSKRSMELFDIEPYVMQGNNRLIIQVEGDDTLTKLAVTGLVQSLAGEMDFSSDGRWLTLDSESIARASSAYGTVMVMQALGVGAPDTSFTLNFKNIEIPAARLLDEVVRFGIIASMLFIAMASCLVLLHFLTFHYDPVPLWQDLETLVSPLLLGSLLTLGLIIVGYDIRVDAQALFKSPFLIAIGLIILLWEVFILSEKLMRRRSSDV